MRPEEVRLVIALFGASGVGKSTVARRLAAELDAACRHCGEEVVDIVAERGGISVEDHHEVDEATRAFVGLSEASVVVEGRFLDKVLSGVAGVRFVRLRCEAGERARRAHESGSRTNPSEEDAADERLMADLYGSGSPSIAVDLWMDIDTTDLEPEGIVAAIVAKLTREAE